MKREGQPDSRSDNTKKKEGKKKEKELMKTEKLTSLSGHPICDEEAGQRQTERQKRERRVIVQSVGYTWRARLQPLARTGRQQAQEQRTE